MRLESIINLNEEWVHDKVQMLWENKQGCKCEQCKIDVMTLALNNLKPHYVSTVKGDVFGKMDLRKQNSEVEVIKVIVSAMEKITENPNHGEG